MIDPWTKTATKLPPEGVEIIAKVDDHKGPRMVMILKRLGNQWWTPNGVTLVNHLPSHWMMKA